MYDEHMTDYTCIKIPVAYAKQIDPFVEQGIYSSRADFVKDQIRNYTRDHNKEKS